MSKAIKTTETIEQLFEGYKAAHSEETAQTTEQEKAMDELERETLRNPHRDQSAAFDKAIALSRASEKAGFILGFKMAINLMSECLG